jgi:uncharacterized protein
MDKKLGNSIDKRKGQRTVWFAAASILLSASIAWVIIFYKPAQIGRPQEPSKPYPYYSEDVTFANDSANVILAGTLTLPSREGKYPAAILISGSGAKAGIMNLPGISSFLC